MIASCKAGPEYGKTRLLMIIIIVQTLIHFKVVRNRNAIAFQRDKTVTFAEIADDCKTMQYFCWGFCDGWYILSV